MCIYFTVSFNSFPDSNLGSFEAAICISSPVYGLRPARADLSHTSKVPNHSICTFSLLATNLLSYLIQPVLLQLPLFV